MDKFSDYSYQKKRLESNISSNFSEDDREYLYEVYELSERLHRNQLRDEGLPYFIHCIRIANSLIEELDINRKEVVAAALLHDAIEDTELKTSEVEEKFGKETAKMVKKLTRDHKGDTEGNKYGRKVQKHKELLKADYDTRAIKVMDLLDNMRSMSTIPERHESRKKFPRWIKEAGNLNIPLARTVSEDVAGKMEDIIEEMK